MLSTKIHCDVPSILKYNGEMEHTLIKYPTNHRDNIKIQDNHYGLATNCKHIKLMEGKRNTGCNCKNRTDVQTRYPISNPHTFLKIQQNLFKANCIFHMLHTRRKLLQSRLKTITVNHVTEYEEND